jgi:hypothetical protein
MRSRRDGAVFLEDRLQLLETLESRGRAIAFVLLDREIFLEGVRVLRRDFSRDLHPCDLFRELNTLRSTRRDVLR